MDWEASSISDEDSNDDFDMNSTSTGYDDENDDCDSFYNEEKVGAQVCLFTIHYDWHLPKYIFYNCSQYEFYSIYSIVENGNR
jgi:hypothetical protein